jgi:hypothetical protein
MNILRSCKSCIKREITKKFFNYFEQIEIEFFSFLPTTRTSTKRHSFSILAVLCAVFYYCKFFDRFAYDVAAMMDFDLCAYDLHFWLFALLST